jgi:acyl-CoA-dependent ceramide synthase
MSASAPAVKTRARSSSIKQAMNEMEGVPGDNSNSQPLAKAKVPSGFVNDLRTFKWMVNPLTSLKLIVLVLAAYSGLESTLPEGTDNPLAPFVFISYPLTKEAGEARTHYTKGPLDVCFLLFYIIVFSFVRQSITEYIVRPFARRLGIRTESKQLRFMEQAYAAIYFTASGTLGLFVMAQQDSWWYKTEHFWLKYPHW